MFVSTNTYTVSEVLPSLLTDQEVMNGVGSITFTRQDKSVARIFLKQGNVYAIDHLAYEHNLWAQLRFEEVISHGNLRSLIRSNKSQRDSLYKILKRSRTKNDLAVTTLQEYLLGAVDDIYTWDNVKVEWRMGDVFPYDAAEVPEFPLSRLITIIVSRSLYKYEKYETWGFKNDEQFLYGIVVLQKDEEERQTITAKNKLEEAILGSGKFEIRNLQNATGFSLLTLMTVLGDLSDRCPFEIENPSGRHRPVPPPAVPQAIPVLENTAHFSTVEEDETLRAVFNTEYHVPEPAKLETQEEFGHSVQVEQEDETSEDLDSFDVIINDATSLEIDKELPPLDTVKIQTLPARQEIPAEELRKEFKAQQELSDLYKEFEEEDIVEETDTEEVTEPSETNEEEEMPDNTDLLSIVKNLNNALSEKKQTIETHNILIKNKHEEIEKLRTNLSKLEEDHNRLVLEREQAKTDYEKALQIINGLK